MSTFLTSTFKAIAKSSLRRSEATEAPPRPPRVLAVEHSRWQSPIRQKGITPAQTTGLLMTPILSLRGALATKQSPVSHWGRFRVRSFVLVLENIRLRQKLIVLGQKAARPALAGRERTLTGMDRGAPHTPIHRPARRRSPTGRRGAPGPARQSRRTAARQRSSSRCRPGGNCRAPETRPH